jgi:hypothetical protein
MKAQRFFTTPEIYRMYKTQILSYLERSTPGLYHAAASVLDRVDRVQRRFLREIGHSELVALQDFRLAPLESRRDMAMLRVLHKIALGTALEKLRAIFPVRGAVAEPLARQRLRHWRPLHSRQLHTEADFTSSAVFKRSLFGPVHCYNKLPQAVVDAESIKAFQAKLQGALRIYAESGESDWQLLSRTNWKHLPRRRLDALFA